MRRCCSLVFTHLDAEELGQRCRQRHDGQCSRILVLYHSELCRCVAQKTRSSFLCRKNVAPRTPVSWATDRMPADHIDTTTAIRVCILFCCINIRIWLACHSLLFVKEDAACKQARASSIISSIILPAGSTSLIDPAALPMSRGNCDGSSTSVLRSKASDALRSAMTQVKGPETPTRPAVCPAKSSP